MTRPPAGTGARCGTPPPVCTGTGSPARVPAESSHVLTVGQCGICGQTVPLVLDGTGRCATHAYLPSPRQPEETGSGERRLPDYVTKAIWAWVDATRQPEINETWMDLEGALGLLDDSTPPPAQGTPGGEDAP